MALFTKLKPTPLQPMSNKEFGKGTKVFFILTVLF